MSFLHLQIDRPRKGAYTRAAYPGKLAAWALDRLDDAARTAGHDPGPPESGPHSINPTEIDKKTPPYKEKEHHGRA
jgi:hypothetical protein